MSIASPIGFLSAHLDHSECELFNEGGEIFAYIPTRENYEAAIGLNVATFTDAEVKARAMGLNPTWN